MKGGMRGGNFVGRTLKNTQRCRKSRMQTSREAKKREHRGSSIIQRMNRGEDIYDSDTDSELTLYMECMEMTGEVKEEGYRGNNDQVKGQRKGEGVTGKKDDSMLLNRKEKTQKVNAKETVRGGKSMTGLSGDMKKGGNGVSKFTWAGPSHWCLLQVQKEEMAIGAIDFNDPNFVDDDEEYSSSYDA